MAERTPQQIKQTITNALNALASSSGGSSSSGGLKAYNTESVYLIATNGTIKSQVGLVADGGMTVSNSSTATGGGTSRIFMSGSNTPSFSMSAYTNEDSNTYGNMKLSPTSASLYAFVNNSMKTMCQVTQSTVAFQTEAKGWMNVNDFMTASGVAEEIDDASTTSDETKKEQISEISEAVFRAWAKVGFKQFKYRERVAEKGENARLHIGVIAQDVIQAFQSEGLNAYDYGLVCLKKIEPVYRTEWVATGTDENGEVEGHFEKTLIKEGEEILGIRYNEALALECAYQRRLTEKLSERLSALESARP